MKAVKLLLVAAAANSLLIQPAKGVDLVRLESRYLGEGLFEYVLEFPDGRYFDKVNFVGLHVAELQGVSFVETPEHWTSDSQGWNHDQMVWEPVPYRRTFRVQATENTYRLGLALLAWGHHWYPWAAPEGEPNREDSPPRVISYVNTRCLVPCNPGDADGSPPEYVDSVPGYPEVRIKDFLLPGDGGPPVGLVCEVGLGVPAIIEASADLKNWVAVGEMAESSGLTEWRTDPPLDPANRFFRVVVRR